MSPAMTAGVTDRLWSVEDLVALCDRAEVCAMAKRHKHTDGGGNAHDRAVAKQGPKEVVQQSPADEKSRPEESRPESNRLHRLDQKDVVVLIAATALALAGIRNDDVPTVVSCLIIAAACFVYLVWIHVIPLALRIVLVMGVVALFSLFGWRGYGRIIQGQQDEVFNHLVIEMGTIEAGQPALLLYTIENNAFLSIRAQSVRCGINRLKNSAEGGLIAPKGVTQDWHNVLIRGGGQGRTDRCDLDWFHFQGPVVCADITIELTYALDIQRDKQRTKQMRFVASQYNGHRWYQESPDTPGNYCDGAIPVS
jgi:hypothetical protein